MGLGPHSSYILLLQQCLLAVGFDLIFTVSIARSATCRYLIYSEADFEVFRPAGATLAPIGVKFGTEEGTEDSLLHAKFYPNRCNG